MKKSHNSRNQEFSYYLCLMIAGSGTGAVTLTNGSRSWRPEKHTNPDPQHWFCLSNLVIEHILIFLLTSNFFPVK
jgi:hypothetical protein